MAKLTEEQQQALTQWVAEGATLNDIQTRLKEQFSVILTYFDTRLLVMELGLTIKDKNRESTPPPSDTTTAEEVSKDSMDDESREDHETDESENLTADKNDSSTGPGGGKVNVSLDTLAIPGTMVSGKATFSDATTVSWYLDQYGRLGLRDAPPGYQPPAADIPVFQNELQKLLR